MCLFLVWIVAFPSFVRNSFFKRLGTDWHWLCIHFSASHLSMYSIFISLSFRTLNLSTSPSQWDELHNSCPMVDRLLWLTCLSLNNQCCHSVILSFLLSRKSIVLSACKLINSLNSNCVWILEFKAFEKKGRLITMHRRRNREWTFCFQELPMVVGKTLSYQLLGPQKQHYPVCPHLFPLTEARLNLGNKAMYTCLKIYQL